MEISWFECSTGIGFLQAAPADKDKGYDQRQDGT
jgi:cold shock CspA family protein